jgi:hypothetical protein
MILKFYTKVNWRQDAKWVTILQKNTVIVPKINFIKRQFIANFIADLKVRKPLQICELLNSLVAFLY